MPLPVNVPLIGSSFDALAAQRAGLINTDLGIISGNMARAAMAEQAQNEYLYRVAAMRNQAERESIQNQMSMDAAQMAYDQQARRDALQMNYEDRRLNAQAARDETNLLMQDSREQAAKAQQERAFAFQREQQTKDLDAAGLNMATAYARKRSQVQEVQRAFDAAQNEFDRLNERKAELEKKTGKTDAEIKELGGMSAAIKAQQKAVNAAKEVYERANSDFGKLSDSIYRDGFMIEEDMGLIRDRATGKTWSFPAAVQQALAAVSTGEMHGPPMPAPASPGLQGTFLERVNLNPGASFAGPLAGLGAVGARLPVRAPAPLPVRPAAPVLSAPTPPPMGTNAFRVGRFTVQPL